MGALGLCLAATAHVGLSGEYNEIHPCIYAEHRHFVGALFENSQGDPAAYAGIRAEIDLPYSLTGFGEIGGAIGYPMAAVVPFGRIGVERDFDGATGALFVMPATDTNNDRLGAVIGFETRVPLIDW